MTNAREVVQFASIKGVVSHNGIEKPAIQYFKPNMYQEHCQKEVIVGGWDVSQRNNGVRGAVVFLRPSRSRNSSESQADRLLREFVPGGVQPKNVEIKIVDCQYKPRVVCILPGQDLVVTNDSSMPIDIDLNNRMDTGMWNLRPTHSQTIRLTDAEKPPGLLRCPCCAWMKAYLWKSRTHFAVVTDQDGQFTLKNVPVPGGEEQLTLWVWHEMLPDDQLKEIGPAKLEPGKTVVQNIQIPN